MSGNAALAQKLPLIFPQAVAWANEQLSRIVREGIPLSAVLLAKAAAVGVSSPEKVRVLEVPFLKAPSDPALNEVAQESGLFGPHMHGMTLGYGIFVCSGKASVRLLTHELRHVHQYEQAGSIEKFLEEYLRQVTTYGYFDAPYEKDARAFENS
jgi:hypothetical protein